MESRSNSRTRLRRHSATGGCGNAVIATVRGEDDELRIPKQNLLQIHFIACAGGNNFLHNGQIATHHIDGLSVERALCDHIDTIITQAVQQTLPGIVCIHPFHHGGHGCVGFLAPLGQFFRLFLTVQQSA